MALLHKSIGIVMLLRCYYTIGTTTAVTKSTSISSDLALSLSLSLSLPQTPGIEPFNEHLNLALP